MTAEQARVAERQAGLDEWRQDSLTALLRWAETIGVDPEQMLLDPTIGIAPAERMLDNEDVGGLPAEDRDWVTSHLLAHVAFILMHNRGGGWAVDDDPGSPTYTRYVVDADGTYYDPVRAVAGYLKSPPGGRDLAAHIADAEAHPTGPATA